MKPIRIYQCEDTTDGILTAVYEAGKSRYGHDFIRLQTLTAARGESMELFSEYVVVETDSKKAQKVITAVKEKISQEAYAYIMWAACSKDFDKADAIYHFIVYGFTLGKQVTSALQIPCVRRVFEMKRRVWMEVHHYEGFIRFQEIKKEPSVLLSVFEPENAILPYLASHFADRLNTENFIIYDKRRHVAAFYSPGRQWFIHDLTREECEQLEMAEGQEETFEELWKTFFSSISIAERENKKLQQNNIPLRYREYMLEFQNNQ